MKYRTPLLVSLISASLLCSAGAFAQQQYPAQQQLSGDKDTFNTAQGQVTINSKMGTVPSTASPPSFEQLAAGNKVITKDAANAYPPLANDFEYAAHGGKSITRAQYEKWLQNLN
ncbi:hypothetical protein [Dyella mobilis]|uniref:DUF4148 domain-containing protein n=1 Tax=Dyella mobilis TaxID=1849582 RepID=A0ABS2KLG8_9GAMM|nr:hypothetical protein [Dyella mobilis]MBM7131743.1 hypothetical protein [Dyella mobilis]GLQ96280.1 hypothetical protein GCM10007863_06980 [Dyella mobilis]